MTIFYLAMFFFLAYVGYCGFVATMNSCYEKTSNLEFAGLMMVTFSGLAGSLTSLALVLAAV